MLDVFADDFVSFLCALARRELPEMKCLCGGHELDTEYPICIIQDLPILEGGVHTHRYEVFLVRGGGDGLYAGRCGQDPLLHDQMVGGILAEHETGVEARLMCQEI